MTASEWLRRVRHDLVKRLVWPARDRRDMGGAPLPGELVARLVDDEGQPATAAVLWADLKMIAPDLQQHRLGLAAFEAALADSVAASRRNDLDGVLALETAFEQLAQDLAREEP